MPLDEAIAYTQDHEPQALTPRVAGQLFALPPSLQKSWRITRTVGLKAGTAPIRPA